jgi:hypothetical protein
MVTGGRAAHGYDRRMAVRSTSLLISAALALTLAACGGSDDDGRTSPAPSSGGAATEQQYAARSEAACARMLSTEASARQAASAMQSAPSSAARQRFLDDYAAYFTDSATALGVLADTPAPASYDAFRAGSKRQADYLTPLFRRLAVRARSAKAAEDIQAILADVSRAEKGLPSVPNPPTAFVRLAPSCAKIAAQ